MLCFSGAMAQPSAVKNVAKSVFALKAYDAEGKLIASTNGGKRPTAEPLLRACFFLPTAPRLVRGRLCARLPAWKW